MERYRFAGGLAHVRRLYSRDKINCPWRVAARTDSRIEPIPCGQRQWIEDAATPLIEIARREGIQVLRDDRAPNVGV